MRCCNHCSKGRLAWRTGLMVMCAVIGDVTFVGFWCCWCYWWRYGHLVPVDFVEDFRIQYAFWMDAGNLPCEVAMPASKFVLVLRTSHGMLQETFPLSPWFEDTMECGGFGGGGSSHTVRQWQFECLPGCVQNCVVRFRVSCQIRKSRVCHVQLSFLHFLLKERSKCTF